MNRYGSLLTYLLIDKRTSLYIILLWRGNNLKTRISALKTSCFNLFHCFLFSWMFKNILHTYKTDVVRSKVQYLLSQIDRSYSPCKIHTPTAYSKHPQLWIGLLWKAKHVILTMLFIIRDSIIQNMNVIRLKPRSFQQWVELCSAMDAFQQC